MKKGKLVNVTTDEAGNIAALLGAKKALYRNAPLLNESQITDVVDEFMANGCDCIIFDTGAIFDVPAYDLAQRVVSVLCENIRKPKVVIFNAPEL